MSARLRSLASGISAFLLLWVLAFSAGDANAQLTPPIDWGNDCEQKGGTYECKNGTPAKFAIHHMWWEDSSCHTTVDRTSLGAVIECVREYFLPGPPICKFDFVAFQESSIDRTWKLREIDGFQAYALFNYGTIQNGSCVDASSPQPVLAWWTREVTCEAGWEPYGNAYCRRPPPCEKCFGNPINAATGAKFQRESDISPTGSGDLSFTRTYNSLGFEPLEVVAGQGGRAEYPLLALGNHWRHNYQRRVILISSTVPVARVVGESGSYVTYQKLSGQWTARDPQQGTLEEVLTGGVQTGWRHLTPQDTQEHFDLSGRLTHMVSRDGRTSTLVYSDGSSSGPNGAVTTDTSAALPAGLLIRVENAFGRALTLAYAANRMLTNVTAPDGQVVSYGYDGQLRLKTATYPGSQTKTYIYQSEEPGNTIPNSDWLLSGIVDENAVRFATFTYDGYRRATSTKHALNVNQYSVSYGWTGYMPASTTSVTMTDPLNASKSYQVAFAGSMHRNGAETKPCGTPGCSGTVSNTVTFHANGRVATQSNFAGLTTAYTYESTRQLVETATENTNLRRVSREWHPIWRLSKRTASPKLRETIAFHGDSGVSCAPGGASTALVCEKKLEATTDTSGMSGFTATLDTTVPARIWSWTYNAQGQVLTATDPRGNVTTYAYHPTTTSQVTQGDLASITTPVPGVGQPAHVTQFTEYDGAGRLKKMIDPNGLETTLAYYPRGWLQTRTVGVNTANPEVTSYTYDNVGQLKRVTQPDTSYVEYFYDDAHRLWKIEDSQGNRITYTLDNLGNRTVEEYRDPAGQLARKLTREYDALNRLKFDRSGYTHAAPTVAQSVTEYAYDNQDNLKKVTDPLGRVTDNDYDAMSRLIKVTDPQTPTRGVTEYGYDGQDNLTNVKDPKLLTTTYTYNGLGDLKTQVSPDTGTTTFTHDVAGNVLTKTDARSVTATYTYDALNRVATISYPAVGTDLAETVTYTYDTCTNGKGRLCSIADKTGTTSYTYDAKGRVTAKSQTNSSVTQTVGYGYNAFGQLSTVTYPSGRVITYTYVNNRPVSVAVNGKTVLNNAVYEPFGPLGGWTWGNSTPQAVNAHLRVFDLDYRAVSVQSDHVGSGPRIRDLTWNLASAITAITEPGNPANSYGYGYDAVDRLTSVTPSGQSQKYGYSYDRNGNRLSFTDTGATTNYTYPGSSHWLTGLTGAQVKTFTLDAVGNTTNDGTNIWKYGGNNRPHEIVTAGGTVSVAINALGQRIKKDSGSVTTRFVYDEAGRLIGEYDAAGLKLKEHVWLGDLPVAVIP